MSGIIIGSIKVWDLGSGQQIKHKLGRGTDDDYSINGMFYCTIDGERSLIIQGWNNKLRLYKVSGTMYYNNVLEAGQEMQLIIAVNNE